MYDFYSSEIRSLLNKATKAGSKITFALNGDICITSKIGQILIAVDDNGEMLYTDTKKILIKERMVKNG